MHSKIFVTMQIYVDFSGLKFHIWLVRFHKMKKKEMIIWQLIVLKKNNKYYAKF